MRKSRIKAKLAADEPALITCLHLIDPSVYEMTSLMGFDGIWLDLEHHGTSVAKASELMRAARVGVSDIVARPAKGEFMRMGRMLEMGAQAIMYPRCNNAEEAAEVVKWAKFAPLGERGFDGGNADGDYCGVSMTEYLEHANRETMIIIQIEEPSALEHAEAVAAVDGVDALMLGPADFSILAGVAGQMDHPLMQEANEKIASAARNTGKHWGRPAATLELSQQYMEMGARLIFHQCDLMLIKNGLEKVQQDFAPLGFSFGK